MLVSRQAKCANLHMRTPTLVDLSKLSCMEFVYAAIFADRDDVYIKFGRSTRPYMRIKNVAHGSPFPLSSAVFAQVGSKSCAISVERQMRRQLAGFRTRGEWFRFSPDQGRVFSATIKRVFGRATGRALVWKEVDVAAMARENAADSRKWHSRVGAPIASLDEVA